MGVIMSGILSKVSGKVAGVVGASWKDKAYLRAWVKPANPNTAAQQTQRTKFSDCVDFAKPLVGQVFNAYTDKFIKSMSGFNFFIKRNIALFNGSPAWGDVKVTEGPLSPVVPSTFTYSGGTVEMAWAKNLGNNGEDTDLVFWVIYDKDTGIFYMSDGEVARSVQADSQTIPDFLTATDLNLYIWPSQYIGTVLDIIANSGHLQGSAP